MGMNSKEGAGRQESHKSASEPHRLLRAESLPVYAMDVGVVDRTTEGRFKRWRTDRFRVFGWGQSDGFGDEHVVPNGVEVWIQKW